MHTTLRDIQWVVTGYLLAIAMVIPVTGWAGRRFGTRRVYLAAMGLFTLGSALCGLAQTPHQLIAFRVLQGLGGGAIAPVGQMILVRAAGPKNLPRVMSLYGAPPVVAPVLGPTIGGLLLVHTSGRLIFYVNVPIGIAALIIGRRNLPTLPPEPAGRIDGARLALMTGLVSLTYGLSQATNAHAMRTVVITVAVGLVLLGAFILRALRVPSPLLDMRLYANKIFAGSSFATFCLTGALTATRS
jgi:EmrB/QacA subfamily drug resistance transporter